MAQRKMALMNGGGAPSHGRSATQWAPWRAVIPSALARNLLGLALFELVFYGAYRSAMAFSPAVSAPFWFPDSVLLCALLCVRPAWWWLLLLGTLPIRLTVDVHDGATVWFLAAVYANDCAKGVLGAFLLRRFLPDPMRFRSLRDFGEYCAIAVVLLPVLSAFGGAAARAGLGHAFWPSFEQWLLGNAVAQLILTPVLFYWVLRPPNPANFSATRVLEAAAIVTGLLITLAIAFQPRGGPHDIVETRSYLPVLFIAWAALRFGMPGATAAVALLTAFAVAAAITGSGFFAGLTPAETASRLQHFLLLRAGPLYLAAVLVEQAVRTRASLRESERRFRSMADHAPVFIWMSGTDGGCEFLNEEWLRFTGRTFAQERGEGWWDGIHPEDHAPSLEIYHKAFFERRPYEMEYRLRRHDGEYRWIVDFGTPRYDANGEFMGYIGTAIDVTERRNQEAALRRSEARYREVVESMTGYVCRLLPDTTLTFVNSAYCSFLGKSRDDLLGVRLLTVLPPAARAAAAEAVSLAAAGREYGTWECEATGPEGTTHWHHWVCHAIDSGACDARELQVVGQDITDRRRAAESIRQLAHATRFAAVGQLTAMVAHEINQPLCAILTNTEAAELMLRKQPPPLEELRAILADIRKDDLRADAAIRNIRSLLYRPERTVAAVDVGATVRHVLQLTAGDALHRRVRLRHAIEGGLPPVTADRSQLEQVLVILIANGMDAMKDTEELKRELVVSVQCAGDAAIEVAVQDRGHGIREQDMPQIFDSFFTTKPDGMGLGLSIARSMIDVHGGRIWAENAPGGGAVLRFTLREYAP